jgi:hypothetical protein
VTYKIISRDPCGCVLYELEDGYVSEGMCDEHERLKNRQKFKDLVAHGIEVEQALVASTPMTPERFIRLLRAHGRDI